ncbi:cupin-like domain-containing protein [Acinetobacter suaedae]|uniref:Cupin-like domain-containing protein n=1 Tax=Acinetobacter suaedae TaxID=2609668 RepID=A0A5P1UWZ8_9GAMM|nr:cupin-like domain-containing protein [Acinetobacter sp. C16S1]QER40643.1 cupin-like domain-containing protein [Acinetobacter sp. C16S1]
MNQSENLFRQFNNLSEEWKIWIVENLERGCAPTDLMHILIKEGLITSVQEATIKQDIHPQYYTWLEQIVQQKQNLSTTTLNDAQKKWLAEAVLDQIPRIEIYHTLITQGANEIDIAIELTQLKQHPYFQIAQQQHFLNRKRDWLLKTLDRFARLNPNYREIQRIPTPNFEQFVQDFYSRNLPVVLTNAIEHWDALEKWSPQYFKDMVGDQEIEIQFNREQDPLFERNSIQHKTKMKMDDYVKLVTQTHHSNNFYMTANNAKASQSSLTKLFEDIGNFHSYTDHTQMAKRSFIWFGPKGAFTPLHHDLTNNFLAQIYGKKKVTLIPALQVPNLYNDIAVFSQIVDPNDPNTVESFPQFQQCSKIECILEKGETLFIPLGWWHCVESLDISISVSFTHFNIDNGGAETFPSAP